MSKVKEIIEKIKELEDQQEELLNDLDWIQTQADEAQQDIDDKDSEIHELMEQMQKLLFSSSQATLADYIDYVINGINGVPRDELRGQYFIDNRWTITDGFVLLDSEKPFENVPCVDGIPNVSYDKKLPITPHRIEIDFDAAERRVLENETEVIKIGNSWVRPKLLRIAIGIVGKPLTVQYGKPHEGIAMECENGRALVMPVRVKEEQ